jgi:membrane protein implicated in regulation of membrane protease activity
MSAPNSITVNFGLTGLFVYLGIGILYHLITGDGPFMWSDPWLYVTMAIWPIFALGWVILVVVIVVVAFIILWWFYEERPKAKRREAQRNERREKGEERRRAMAKATPPATNG